MGRPRYGEASVRVNAGRFRHMPCPVIRLLDLTGPPTAAAVLALQRAAYAVEADLIGFDGIPGLHDTPASLRTSGETFAGAWRGGALVGAVSYRRAGDVLDVHRLVVDPASFRTGVATALLRFAEAAEDGVGRIVVSTGERNAPARALYARAGYRLVGRREVAPGVVVVGLEKRLSA
jgi:ribosomal protein S18 acetylase RimI-like enzyme